MKVALVRQCDMCSVFVSFWIGKEPRRAGGQTYSVREMPSSGYLFCFVRQSVIVIE